MGWNYFCRITTPQSALHYIHSFANQWLAAAMQGAIECLIQGHNKTRMERDLNRRTFYHRTTCSTTWAAVTPYAGLPNWNICETAAAASEKCLKPLSHWPKNSRFTFPWWTLHLPAVRKSSLTLECGGKTTSLATCVKVTLAPLGL